MLNSMSTCTKHESNLSSVRIKRQTQELGLTKGHFSDYSQNSAARARILSMDSGMAGVSPRLPPYLVLGEPCLPEHGQLGATLYCPSLLNHITHKEEALPEWLWRQSPFLAHLQADPEGPLSPQTGWYSLMLTESTFLFLHQSATTRAKPLLRTSCPVSEQYQGWPQPMLCCISSKRCCCPFRQVHTINPV